MARRTTAAAKAETTEAPTTEEAAAPRRRRRRAVDHASEAAALTAALLKARGARGATLAELQTVTLWARGVHDEGAALASLARQPRRAKSQGAPERLAAFQVNKHLLDGVLAGTFCVDVNEAGQVSFGHAG